MSGACPSYSADPGTASGPLFSPDGSRVAFTGEFDGNQDVYVVPAAGGELPERFAPVRVECVQGVRVNRSHEDPAAGNDNSKGNAYNASADRRSWKAMEDFFAEVLTRS